MKIDFSQVITQLDGSPVPKQKQSPEDADVSLTLKDATVEALCAPMSGDENVPADTRYKRAHLAMKIYDATEPLELSAEQVVEIKNAIGKRFAALVLMRAWDLIEGVSE